MNKTAVVFLIASFGVAVIFVFLLTMSSTNNNDDGVISGVSNISDSATDTTTSNEANDTPTEVQDVEELAIETLIEGEGDEAVEGDVLVVHYSGTLLDGTPFDNSYDRGQPFELTLGAGGVIQGWEQGLLGAKAGETRMLTIPSALGYGEFGSPPTIPGGAGLQFEVEVLEIK